MPEVRHQPDAHRFVATTEAGEAELVYERPDDATISFVHTHVPEAARGQGVGRALAEAGLDYARERGLRVDPACPFVAAYVERHPEVQGLVGADGERPRLGGDGAADGPGAQAPEAGPS